MVAKIGDEELAILITDIGNVYADQKTHFSGIIQGLVTRQTTQLIESVYRAAPAL